MGEHETEATLVVQSSRFGEFTVPSASVIEFPSGLVGMPTAHRFVLLDYKEPFSWLQSLDDPTLAFVVIDGSNVVAAYQMRPPRTVKECDFRDEDEVASLLIITVRPNPKETTANLKGPLFVNLRNRKGVQWIFDDPKLSARHPLWADEASEGGVEAPTVPSEKK